MKRAMVSPTKGTRLLTTLAFLVLILCDLAIARPEPTPPFWKKRRSYPASTSASLTGDEVPMPEEAQETAAAVTEPMTRAEPQRSRVTYRHREAWEYNFALNGWKEAAKPLSEAKWRDEYGMPLESNVYLRNKMKEKKTERDPQWSKYFFKSTIPVIYANVYDHLGYRDLACPQNVIELLDKYCD